MDCTNWARNMEFWRSGLPPTNSHHAKSASFLLKMCRQEGRSVLERQPGNLPWEQDKVFSNVDVTRHARKEVASVSKTI